MRPYLAALLVSVSPLLPAPAADLRHFEDAPLRAVTFIDKEEGWAAGDEGVVWHTIDGGKRWERQPTGLRASLRSIQFLHPYTGTGWVVGREELPHGGGSVGVLLITRDAGETWQRVSVNAMPGLHKVQFFDASNGIVVGDGSDQFPTGMFRTSDGGRTWKPVPGPRCTSWLAADFQDPQTGALAGAWGRLASLRQGTLIAADIEALRHRTLRGLQIAGDRGVAVGQGGAVLISTTTAGARWGYADLKLPSEILSCCDFHAVSCRGDRTWIVGRPGSIVLHSADRGQSWVMQPTGQPLPLHAVFFRDEEIGWAVGELGTIVATRDGGKSWTVQRRGGQRAAALLLHARATGLPLDTIALLGGEEGYLTTALRVTASDPASAAPGRASEADRLTAAVRQVGGATGEVLWQFPVPQHLARSDRPALLASWDRLHDQRAAEQLLRQLVLTLRIWQPSVVITDHPDVQATGFGADALVAEAVHEAITRAAETESFPEQLQQLGLKPWQASKLYARWQEKSGAPIVLDLNAVQTNLQGTARELATPAAGLLADVPVLLPSQRFYRLLQGKLPGAASHRDLMEGLALAPGGTARRTATVAAAPDPGLEKAARTRRTLQVLAEMPPSALNDPNKLLAQIDPALAALPDEQGAVAAFAVASHFTRIGQWPMAREAYLRMVDRFSAHPLSADAYRWLIQHNSSSEARRRQDLGQFLLVVQPKYPKVPGTNRADTSVAPTGTEVGFNPLASLTGGVVPVKAEKVDPTQLQPLGERAAIRQWYQGCLDIEPRLAAFGPLHATDPASLFCLQAARRQLGDFDKARQWYTRFVADQPDGPWRTAAAAELWLTNRTGPAPKPVAASRWTDSRPFLDGQFDDPCWHERTPLRLHDAIGSTGQDYPTEVRLAHDKEYLYLALRCQHPAERHVPPVKVRPRDADLRPYDRVSLLLDLDRDYNTYFHFQVDQRGCVCEDCWGDLSWNPRWFVAARSDATGWQVEAAIPLSELSGEPVTIGRAWACNVVRILPGRGVQAFSTPADVQPRPEGMGLLLFSQENPRPVREKD